MKLIMENWNKFVYEEEQVEEGIMDFFRSKDPADVALKEVEQYLETTSQNAFETARAVLSQNIKKKTSSANFITQNFDRKDIRKMQNILQPLQIKFSTGDQSGQEVKNLFVTLRTEKVSGVRTGEYDQLTFEFEFQFNVTEVGENRYQVSFGVAAPSTSAGDNVLLPSDLGAQVGDMMQKQFYSTNIIVEQKKLLPLLMSRARYIIDVLPALYRFVIAESYINYSYGGPRYNVDDVFNDVLKPSYEEIQSKEVRV